MKKLGSGQCYCGRVKFKVQFPSKFCAHCHCKNCRRAHGAAFVTWVGFPESQVKIIANKKHLGHYKTETKATRSFCKVCGTTLFFKSPRWAGEIHIVRSNFKGGVDRKVQGNAFFKSRVDWINFKKPIA